MPVTKEDEENAIYHRFYKGAIEGKVLKQLLLSVPDKHRKIATLGFMEGTKAKTMETLRRKNSNDD